MPADPDLAAALSRPDLPLTFERFQIVLAPGERRPTLPDAWAGCLVLVDEGRIEVDCGGGGHRAFVTGDLLALGWLPLREIRNVGSDEARLLAIRRREPPAHRILSPAGRNDRYLRHP
jgi:hypothetical protein